MRAGFTLVELLAVVAIMAILMVIALPAFHLFAKKDIDTAAAELRATLRLARQYAVTRRQEVFVVFPTADDPAPSEEDVDKLLRSYAVLALTNDSPEQYEYVTEWHYLVPVGLKAPRSIPSKALRKNGDTPEASRSFLAWPVISSASVDSITCAPSGMAG